MINKPLQLWRNDDFCTKIFDSDWYRTMFKLQDAFVHASFLFYYGKGLKYIPLPVTSNSSSSPMGLGSDSIPVSITLKDREFYLADSMQFLLEFALRLCDDNGTFYLMPSFRGEPTDERHLSQFYHSEAEIKGDLQNVIELVNEYVSFLSQYLLDNLAEDIFKYSGTLEHLKIRAASTKIEQITFSRALAELREHDGAIVKLDNRFENITPLGEKILLENHNGYLWVTNYDKMVVPFYQKSEGDFAKNADLLMGIGETVGAGERHTNEPDVLTALNEHQIDPSEYDWYLKMKKTAPLQTAGFGMGMERFLVWVLNHDDVRDCQIVPRIDGIKMEP